MVSQKKNTTVKNQKEEPSSSSADATDDRWIYPSEQQYYNAVKRKGWSNVNAEDVPMIVKIHNEVNERSWGKVLKWEECRDGDEEGVRKPQQEEKEGGESSPSPFPLHPPSTSVTTIPSPPTLVRFLGRPKDRSPKSYLMTAFMGYDLFDRHDWIIQRTRLPFFYEKPFLGEGELVKEEQRYVVDFYDSKVESKGNQNGIYVDVRPAFEGGGVGDRVWSWITGKP